MTADENAEEPEDTPKDKAVNGGGVHDVQEHFPFPIEMLNYFQIINNLPV